MMNMLKKLEQDERAAVRQVDIFRRKLNKAMEKAAGIETQLIAAQHYRDQVGERVGKVKQALAEATAPRDELEDIK